MSSQNSSNTSQIFSPFRLSAKLEIKNRIIMAPMTRRFADKEGKAISSMANYYARRADTGFIVTEGTLISEDAIGYGNIPGIYNSMQIEAWKEVTKKVHNEGGVIFMQLWHCGRVSHPSFHKGRLPISSSATVLKATLGSTGLISGQSREASLEEISSLVNEYAVAAKNAILAGFDGIEIHGANGYLVDQFLHYCTNQRQDNYGNTPENMSRFALEIIDACVKEIGKDRVGIRLSPGGHMAGIITENHDKHVFSFLLEQIYQRKIAYVHVGNFDDSILYPELDNQSSTEFIRTNYKGTLITSGGYNIKSAHDGLLFNKFDLVAFGRPFLANHDLIYKLKNNIPLENYDPKMLSTLV